MSWLENGTGEMGGINPALEIDEESTVASRIRKVRISHGLTQIEFAEKLGVNNVLVSQYEREIAKPRAEVVDRISQEFGVSKEWILTGAGSYELNREEIASEMKTVDDFLWSHDYERRVVLKIMRAGKWAVVDKMI